MFSKLKAFFGEEIAVPATQESVAAILAKTSQAQITHGDFNAVSGSRISFLPYLQLFGGSSDAVKEGKIPIAHYGTTVGKEKTLKDLGTVISVIPLAWRPKAMNTKTKPVLAFHNPSSNEFLNIRKMADADTKSGCIYGPEFLLWHPTERFITFLMGSKTARNEAPAIQPFLPSVDGKLSVITLSAVLINGDEHKWHGPKAALSAQTMEAPPADELGQMMHDFLHPKDSVIEAAPAGAENPDR